MGGVLSSAVSASLVDILMVFSESVGCCLLLASGRLGRVLVRCR